MQKGLDRMLLGIFMGIVSNSNIPDDFFVSPLTVQYSSYQLAIRIRLIIHLLKK